MLTIIIIIIIDITGCNELVSVYKTVTRPTSPKATPDDGQRLNSRANFIRVTNAKKD